MNEGLMCLPVGTLLAQILEWKTPRKPTLMESIGRAMGNRRGLYSTVEHRPTPPLTILVVASEPTTHVRFNDLVDRKLDQKDTDSANVIESDVPIVVQHTELDSRQAEDALLSTIAFSENE